MSRASNITRGDADGHGGVDSIVPPSRTSSFGRGHVRVLVRETNGGGEIFPPLKRVGTYASYRCIAG